MVFFICYLMCTAADTGVLPASTDPPRSLGAHTAVSRHAGICVAFNPTIKQKALLRG